MPRSGAYLKLWPSLVQVGLGVVVWQAVSGDHPSDVRTVLLPWSSLAGAFMLHSAMVFACATIGFPWMVWRWFDWVQPYVHVPPSGPAWSWYWPNLALVNLTMAIGVGYGMARGLKTAAVWVWTVPAFVLGVKILAFSHPAASSVLFQAPPKMTSLEYFFGVLPGVMPNEGSMSELHFDFDYERVLAQIRYTASFYAGVGYTIGALVARYRILTKMFVFEKPEEVESASESSNANEIAE